MVKWLEKSARVAGISAVFLEVRAKNQAARAFYRALGYREKALLALYYSGREAAITMVHDLRVLGTGGSRPRYIAWRPPG